MDTKQFIASLVSSIAWPIAVVIIALLFREQFARLLMSRPLKRLKLGPGGAEFEFALEKAATRIEAEIDAPALPPAEQQEPTIVDGLRDVADKSPDAAIMASTARLERQLRELLAGAGDQEGAESERGLIWVARRAKDKGLIGENIVGIIRDLAFLRNLAAHGHTESDTKAAHDYLNMIVQVSEAIGHPPELAR
jgi:hypothetical protein